MAGTDLPRIVGDATGAADTSVGSSRLEASRTAADRARLDRRALGNAIRGSSLLALRDLRHRLRRVAVSILGTSVVLTLALVLAGLVSQFDREPAVTMDAIGASHWVLPTGVVSPFTAVAPFGQDVADGVTGPDATGIVVARYAMSHGEVTESAMVIGRTSGAPLADPAPVVGRRATGPTEVVLSQDAGVALGGTVTIGANTFDVVGLVPETTVIAGIPLVFVDLQSARDLVAGGQPLVSTVLTRGAPSDIPPGLHAVTADEVAEALREPIKEPVKTIRMLLVLLAIVAAMILTAVTYLSTIDRERDVAVLRAMGTPAGVLAFGVALQAVLLALLAAVAALVLEPLVAAVFPMRVHVTNTSRLVLPLAAMTIAAGAARGAIRRTLRIDPADAFAGQGG